MQISQRYALLFHEGGVCQFTDLENDAAYDSLISPGPDRSWALVDSNEDLARPTGAFNTGRVFFTVQAASPRPQRVQWLNTVDSQYFYMKGWSLSEVIQAYVGLPHGRSRRSYLVQPLVSWALGSLHGTTALEVTLGLCSVSEGHGPLRQ